MRLLILKTLLVGLTGGIVTGKSTVVKIFKKLGAQVIDADEIARMIVRPGEKAWHSIVENFGKGILKENLEINRKELAKIVFSDQTKLTLLNKITHPEIIAIIKKRIEQIRNCQKDVICIIDIPLLFEAHLEYLVDKIIVVYLNREEQIKRLLIRNNLTHQEARMRIDSQIPIEKKIKKADYVIDNCGSLVQTEQQARQIWQELKKYLTNNN